MRVLKVSNEIKIIFIESNEKKVVSYRLKIKNWLF